jgi:hypothetical protein
VHVLRGPIGSQDSLHLSDTNYVSWCGGEQVFEGGSLYDPMILDIKDEDLLASVGNAISNVAAFSLAANYPTLASIPHSVINGYKNVLAVAVATDYSFPLADKVLFSSHPNLCACLFRSQQ